MTNIFLIRHGETEWNRKQVFRGWADIELSPVGIRQAETTAQALKGLRIDAVYSSPLSRARQTAETIARLHNLKVTCLEGFKDMNFGQWQGLPHQQVKEEYPETYEKWLREPHRTQIPDGETLAEVRRRSRLALKQILSEDAHRTVLIVSHRVVNKLLLCTFLGLDNSHFWQIRQDPCAVNLVRYANKKFVVCLLNDTCHLTGITGKLGGVDF